MIKKTRLEIYAYTHFGNVKAFAKAMGLTQVTLWNWIVKRIRPSKTNSRIIEKKTNGEITEDYLRNHLD